MRLICWDLTYHLQTEASYILSSFPDACTTCYFSLAPSKQGNLLRPEGARITTVSHYWNGLTGSSAIWPLGSRSTTRLCKAWHGKGLFLLGLPYACHFLSLWRFKYWEVTSSGAGFSRLHLSVCGPCASLCNVLFVCKKQLWSSVTQTLLNGETHTHTRPPHHESSCRKGGHPARPNCRRSQAAQAFPWWKWKCHLNHASGFSISESQLNMTLLKAVSTLLE